jgi:hypothetical protein
MSKAMPRESIPEMATTPGVTELLEAIRLDERPASAGPFDTGAIGGLLPLIRYEQVGAWLWHRLLRASHPAEAPRPPQHDLRDQGLRHAALSLQVSAATIRTVKLLSSHGIHPVLLKGVACAALADRYPYFRFRPTGDVDLLVEPGSAESAWQLLFGAGFRRGTIESVHPDHHHLPALISDLNVPVEIHVSASLFWSPAESWNRLGSQAREVSWQGCRVLVPPPTELFWHAVVHSLGDGAFGCRLRNFLTAGALLLDDGGLDWDLLATRIADEPIREHDSRFPVPPRGVRRWISVAAWLANRPLPSDLMVDSAAGDLLKVLEFRRRQLARWPKMPLLQRKLEEWMDEATRTQLGLGLTRLGHWQPRSRRPKRLVTSMLYRVLYWGAR